MSGQPFFSQPEPTTSYMYFSLTTITTTGYGDFTSSTEFGRLLSMAEAVIGQVYLVTFVALLVGLFAANFNARRKASSLAEQMSSTPEAD